MSIENNAKFKNALVAAARELGNNEFRIRRELDSFKHLTLNKVKKGECEGNCEIHLGEIKAVRVYDKTYGNDWGWFSYCENAIKEDESRGMGFIYS